MKIKLKTLTLVTSAILAVGLVTGCTNSSDNDSSNTKQTSNASDSGGSDNGGDEKNTETSPMGTEKNESGVIQSINAYYNTLINESDTALENATKVEDTVREATNDETYEAFVNSSNPFESFDELSDEDAKKLADEIQKLNPSANLIDFSGMKDSDRAVLNLLMIASSTVMSTISDQTIEITVPEDKIKIKDDKVNVAYTDIDLKVNEENQEMTDIFGSSTINLTYDGTSWKLDGQKTYEAIYASSQTNTTDEEG